VPNLGGETKFESGYSGNPHVNASRWGWCRKDEILLRKATERQSVIMSAPRPDATASTARPCERRVQGRLRTEAPNVQVGDPFMEKLLLRLAWKR